ncbi:hypothetical protein WOLCODRAFT_152194 [Wolfiporia cocos MD-104 SS10]|uniref:Uncharacterized protein n=1 Tax=Wolfiporia cocos (strain MD-104) TaxID=742152 RepID=A0A2H3K174_WOLCO|nr:hypothetical protein WOLCODRAFT_152194 [Wolfiporia cocos MD-104 SS10]
METLRPARGDRQLRVTMEEMTDSRSFDTVEATYFQLYKRTRHPSKKNMPTKLDVVLNASHQSAGEPRENSRPKADELVRPAKEAEVEDVAGDQIGTPDVSELYATLELDRDQHVPNKQALGFCAEPPPTPSGLPDVESTRALSR